jgi:hypothetical protein
MDNLDTLFDGSGRGSAIEMGAFPGAFRHTTLYFATSIPTQTSLPTSFGKK